MLQANYAVFNDEEVIKGISKFLKKISGMKVMLGLGKNISKFMWVVLLLLVGDLWPRKFIDSLIRLL